MLAIELRRQDGAVLCERLCVAERPWSRMRGLLGRADLPRGEGLLLRPAGSVHTAFMRFAIDVVFLDRELRVVHIAHSVPPWRAASKRGAKVVVELAAGECSRRDLQIDDALQLAQRDDQSSRVIAQRSWSRQRPPILRYRGE
jgi:uncharacterized membrane protein (UPF0127 family)